MVPSLIVRVLPIGFALAGLTACGSSSPTSPPSTQSGGGATTLPPVTAAPSSTGGTADAGCSQASFGAPLPPINPPANVHQYSAAPAMSIDTSKLYRATITTPRGAIVLCLEPRLAPATVNNFVTLARNHFFDGLTFHRVVPGFVIQGGDPKGDGSGGPGYQFPDEPVRQPYTVGAVAMANSGPNSNGSQFFICSGDQCTSLQPKYNLFGHVQSGQSVVSAIIQGDVMQSVTVQAQQ